MYTIHWEYMAGSIVVQAVLEEVGAIYQMRHVDMANGEHKREEYLRINPVARVPALTLPDGKTIGETSAIVTVLGEHFPNSKLYPEPNSANRADFLFWLNVMATSGYLTISRGAHPERYAVEPSAINQVEKVALNDLHAFYRVIDSAISGDPYFLPIGFTPLDIYLAMLVEFSVDKEALYSKYASIAVLCREVGRRPAFRAAMETHAIPKHAV